MTRGRTLTLVGGGLLIIVVAGGFGIWRSNVAAQPTTAAKEVIQQQLEKAIKQSVQIIPSTVVPMNVRSLSSSKTTQLLASERTALGKLYASTNNAEVGHEMWGYGNELQAITYERNTAMTFSKFSFTDISLINSNSTANVSFTAQTSTTRQVRSGRTTPWQTLHIPGNWSGTATLQYTNGQWLIQALRLTDSDAG